MNILSCDIKRVKAGLKYVHVKYNHANAV